MLKPTPRDHGAPCPLLDTAHLCFDGGLLALREVERRLSTSQRLAACGHDPRAPEKVKHDLDEITRFRTPMERSSASSVIAAGCEDSDDADALRTAARASGRCRAAS